MEQKWVTNLDQRKTPVENKKKIKKKKTPYDSLTRYWCLFPFSENIRKPLVF